MKVCDIIVGNRHRKEMGDIEALAKNIEEVGLLHPIVVTPDNHLIAGARRLKAFEFLKREGIPATVVSLSDIVNGEFSENTQRLNFTPSEMVAIAKAVKPKERAEAKERQGDTQLVGRGRQKKDGGGKLPPPKKTKGKTRDKVAAYVGISGRTLDKAEVVVQAAEKEPEKYASLVEKMDTTGKVDSAYNDLKKQQIKEQLAASPDLPPSKYKTIVIDPPWEMTKIAREVRPNQGVVEYPQMSVDQIAERITISDLTDAEGCHIYLWTTHKHLPDALHLFTLWGVRYQGLLTWVKNVGFTPFSWMYSTEHCLFGRTGALDLLVKGKRLDFQAKVREHSRKPQEFYDLVKSVSPGPRLDMFCREAHDGFERWGNQTNKFTTQP